MAIAATCLGIETAVALADPPQGSPITPRAKRSYVILNKFPYNNGHLMVVPFRHVKDLAKMKPAEQAEMLELAGLSIKALEKTMFPQGHNLGINLGAAGGAGIRDHLHFHVVPRWIGDTNWMPVLGETKTMIEYLWETYDRLAPVVAKLTKKIKKAS